MEINRNPELKGFIEKILESGIAKKSEDVFKITNEEEFWDVFLLTFLLYRVANRIKYFAEGLQFLEKQSEFRNIHLIRQNKNKILLVIDRDIRYGLPLPLIGEEIDIERLKRKINEILQEFFSDEDIAEPLVYEFVVKENLYKYLKGYLFEGFESGENIERWDRLFLCLLAIYLNARLMNEYKIKYIRASPLIRFENGKNREADIIIRRNDLLIDIEMTMKYPPSQQYMYEKMLHMFYDCIRDGFSKAHLMFIGFLPDIPENKEESLKYELRKEDIAHLKFPFTREEKIFSFSSIQIPPTLDEIKDEKGVLMKDFKGFIEAIVDKIEDVMNEK